MANRMGSRVTLPLIWIVMLFSDRINGYYTSTQFTPQDQTVSTSQSTVTTAFVSETTSTSYINSQESTNGLGPTQQNSYQSATSALTSDQYSSAVTHAETQGQFTGTAGTQVPVGSNTYSGSSDTTTYYSGGSNVQTTQQSLPGAAGTTHAETQGPFTGTAAIAGAVSTTTGVTGPPTTAATAGTVSTTTGAAGPPTTAAIAGTVSTTAGVTGPPTTAAIAGAVSTTAGAAGLPTTATTAGTVSTPTGATDLQTTAAIAGVADTTAGVAGPVTTVAAYVTAGVTNTTAGPAGPTSTDAVTAIAGDDATTAGTAGLGTTGTTTATAGDVTSAAGVSGPSTTSNTTTANAGPVTTAAGVAGPATTSAATAIVDAANTTTSGSAVETDPVTTANDHVTSVSPSTSGQPTTTPVTTVETNMYPYEGSAYRHRSFDHRTFYHYRYSWYSYRYGYRSFEYWYHNWYAAQHSIPVSVSAFCKGYKRMYISQYGYVSFDYPNWASPYSFGRGYYWWSWYNQRNRAIIAPFLAYTSVCGDSEIHYAHFTLDDKSSEAKQILDRATQDIRSFEQGASDFRAVDVTIVTWVGMLVDYWSYYYYNQGCQARQYGNTYQMVLVSDGAKTYTMFNYKYGQIRAKYLYWYYMKFGHEFDRRNVQVNYISGTSAMRQIDQITGNTGMRGRWIFRLFEMTRDGNTVCQAAEAKCLNWLANAPNGQYLKPVMPPCPCNSGHARIDRRYSLERYDYYSSKPICFRARRHVRAYYTSHETMFKVRQRCCYRRSWFRRMCTPVHGCQRWFNGPLITSQTSLQTPGYMNFRNYRPRDSKGHTYCCVHSNKFCEKFYYIRPTDTCSRYRPPRVIITWGDPHITTLDGHTYTFNGHGEYWMVKTAHGDEGFQLQARTTPAIDKDGRTTQATVFSAFAAKDNGSSVFQIQQHNGGLTLLVDGIQQSVFLEDGSKTEETYTEDVVVEKNGTGALSVAFPSGWSMTVTSGKTLSVQVAAPSEGVNQSTRGLLGVFNDDVTDDFTDPQGRTISVNSSAEDVFHKFGKLWMTSETTSLFTNQNGKTWADYVDESFIPDFDPCKDQNLKTEAETKCGSNQQCISDYCSTRDEALAQDSKTRQEDYQEENAVRENRNPTISATSPLRVTRGVQATLTVTTSDPDGDTVTVEMTGNYTGSATFNNATGEFSWTPANETPVDISFTARDNKGGSAPTFDLHVIYCNACSGNGECDFDDFEVNGKVSTFSMAGCNCSAGWEGSDCDTDYDGCADKPCEEFGTNCTDLTPEEEAAGNSTRRYRCGCLPGYDDVMGTCVDIDECLDNTTNECDQVCNNFEGNYSCSCYDGYRREQDSCADIDECQERTSGCQQECDNSNGGFNCRCYTGYTLNSDSKTCTLATTCTTPCDHICVPGPPERCECRPGFTVSGSSCNDIDECSDGTHKCSHTCVNQPGDYRCTCPAGTKLSSDQRTCQECEELRWGMNCENFCDCGPNVLECHKATGCSNCVLGWAGQGCNTNIDECAGTSPCSGNKVCVDTIGSYSCVCPEGFMTDEDDNCVSDPEPEEDLTTVGPTEKTAAEDSLSMTVKFTRKFNNAYNDFSDGLTINLIGQLTKLFDWVYGNMTHFTGTEITGFREGSLLVDYEVLLDKKLSVKEKSVAAAVLIALSQANGGTLTLDEFSSFTVTGSFVRTANGTLVLINNTCSYMESVNGCNNGGCNIEEDNPTCVCDDGYSGEHCAAAVASRHDNTVLIAAIAGTLGALLIITIIIVIVYMCMKQKHKVKVADSETDICPMSEIDKGSGMSGVDNTAPMTKVST